MITVSRSATIPEVLKVLTESRILSVPVVDEEGRAVIILSVADIMNYVLGHFGEKDISGDNMLDFVQKKDELMRKRLYEISFDLGEIDAPYSVLATDRLAKAVRVMIQKKTHRILTVDEQDKPLTLISQSRIISLLRILTNETKLKKPVKDLNLGLKDVFTVTIDKTPMDAFRIMQQKRVSAIAVVDENGVLVGTISVSDIKAIGNNLKFFELLAKPITMYLQHIQTSTREMDDIRPSVLKCKPNNTLDFVMKELTNWKVHRLFVVDENHKPIGVVSLYDILC
jgi:CBS domain-containing protein